MTGSRPCATASPCPVPSGSAPLHGGPAGYDRTGGGGPGSTRRMAESSSTTRRNRTTTLVPYPSRTLDAPSAFPVPLISFPDFRVSLRARSPGVIPRVPARAPSSRPTPPGFTPPPAQPPAPAGADGRHGSRKHATDLVLSRRGARRAHPGPGVRLIGRTSFPSASPEGIRSPSWLRSRFPLTSSPPTAVSARAPPRCGRRRSTRWPPPAPPCSARPTARPRSRTSSAGSARACASCSRSPRATRSSSATAAPPPSGTSRPTA